MQASGSWASTDASAWYWLFYCIGCHGTAAFYAVAAVVGNGSCVTNIAFDSTARSVLSSCHCRQQSTGSCIHLSAALQGEA